MSDYLHFSDLNFKLLVIDELMYNQEVLEPQFDLPDWSDEHDIDLEEHLDETIDGALGWFEELDIPAELANKVEVLEWDGGLEVFANIVFNWSGEDERIDIRTLADADQFPKLTSIIVPTLEGVEGVEELRARGVEVEEF